MQAMVRRKILVVGPSSVGKSTYVRRLSTGDNYSEANLNIPTVGCEFNTVPKTDFLVWDFAGSERFVALLPHYVNDVELILLFYDVASRSSFDEACKLYWVGLSEATCPIVLVGNKSDVGNVVPVDVVSQFCNDCCVECSNVTISVRLDTIETLLALLPPAAKRAKHLSSTTHPGGFTTPPDDCVPNERGASVCETLERCTLM